MKKIKSRTKVRISLALILLCALFLTVIDFPAIYDKSIDYVNWKYNKEFSHLSIPPFRLGLDLQGGTHLVYEADTSEIEGRDEADAVDGVRDVIERRVNAFGVAEPVVQVNKAKGSWRIIVELAGVQDVKKAIQMIGETPLLEFKEQNTEPPRELTEEERVELETFNNEAKSRADKALAEVVEGKDFSEAVREYSDNEIDKETGGDMGWINHNSNDSHLVASAEKTEIGQVYPEVITGTNSFQIIKVNDKREEGKEVQASHILICWQGTTRCESEINQDEALAQINEIKEKAHADNFEALAKEYSTDPTAQANGGDLGWFSSGQMVPEFEEPAFAMQNGEISDVIETQFGYHLILKIDERPITEYKLSQIYINTKTETDILPAQDAWKNTELTGAQLESAQVQFDPNTSIPSVSLEFDDEGKKLFADITTRNVGQPVAIFLDNEPISVPTVNEPIKEGKAVITGSFSIDEAKTLSMRLNAGALPVPISLISQQTVGASLGHESIEQSLWAGIIGLILVAIFMIAYYRLPGLLSVVALVIYGVVVLAVFKTIPVTLTLAGIAGFILSIGMAVDANVLIFERLKEELKVGKPLGTAIEEGFKRAWTSIRDGNVSTLITCLILAWFGTSMIKGFAITLGIGVLISMFSAIVITRLLLKLFINPDKQAKRLWLFGVKKKSS